MPDNNSEEMYTPVSPRPFNTEQTDVSGNSGTRPDTTSPFIPRNNPVEKGWQRISTFHGRSIENSIVGHKVIWADEHGNLFGSRSWKGWPMEDVAIEEDIYSPYEFRARGLKDDVGLIRIEKVSELMRTHHLPTERVVQVRELEEIQAQGIKIKLKNYKANFDLYQPVVNGDRNKAKQYLENAHFYAVERETQVGERLKDIEALSCAVAEEAVAVDGKKVFYEGEEYTRAEFLQKIETIMTSVFKSKDAATKEGAQFLKKCLEKSKSGYEIISTAKTFREKVGEIFRWVNTANEIKGLPERFDVHEEEDILRYFGEFLPQVMGAYLAKLHGELGLAHGFTTEHNWSAVGTLYDLDSVHGEPLGDSKITEKDIARDINWTVTAIARLMAPMPMGFKVPGSGIYYRGVIEQINLSLGADPSEFRNKAEVNFLVSYLRTIGGSPSYYQRIIHEYSNETKDDDKTANLWTDVSKSIRDLAQERKQY